MPRVRILLPLPKGTDDSVPFLFYAEKQQKGLDISATIRYNNKVAPRQGDTLEHGPVVQLVRTLACHARGRQFEPDSGRHLLL